MSTDVIGSRYRLGSVIACTPEVTTWQARDTWLDGGVLLVTPEPGYAARFSAISDAVMDRASTHLLRLYDVSTAEPFVVFDVPEATFSDAHVPREEEDVLAVGHALGDALEALHGRGVVHGELHPGSVAVTSAGEAVLSPWPLAPRPEHWSGPGGFGSAPDERHDASAQDDLRALGAVLLGALAGPPLLSSQQVDNLERELADRAPTAVTIADRALTPSSRGGYEDVAELRRDCEAALSGRPIGLAAAVVESSAVDHTTVAASAGQDAARSEGRRAALVVAATGVAVLAGLGFSGALGAHADLDVHPATSHADGCVGPDSPSRCDPADPQAPAVVAAPASPGQSSSTPARLADNPVKSGTKSSPAPRAAAPANGASAPATSTTTTARPGATTTTTSAAASPTTTSTSAPASTTTSTSTATSTTTPTSTTTSSSTPNSMEAGTNASGSGAPGPGGAGSPHDQVSGPGPTG